MMGAMSRRPPPPHARCVNLLWEPSPRDGKPRPGRFCSNRFGVIHVLDCPVYQGLDCRLFEERSAEAEPKVPTDEELETVRTRLAEDYLRWPYFRRVARLRGADVGDAVVLLDEEAPEPEEEEAEEGEQDLVVAPLPVLPEPGEEAFKEKYPGQRRSEDRVRPRRAATGEEDAFSAGIFDEPVLEDPEVEGPTAEEAAAAAPEPEPPAETGEAPPTRRRPRRRGPRRRTGGKGEKPSSGNRPADGPGGPDGRKGRRGGSPGRGEPAEKPPKPERPEVEGRNRRDSRGSRRRRRGGGGKKKE